MAPVIGRQAVVLGMETLDVARCHKKAMEVLVSPGASARSSRGIIGRAKVFFEEAIVPIEETHGAAIKDAVHVNQLAKRLRQRTIESSASTQRLKVGIARRQAVEGDLKKSAKQRLRLLRVSRRLKSSMRDQVRESLALQEARHRKMSRQLYNDMAQSLVAINIRLLAVSKATKNASEKLKKDIAETQRQVNYSAKRINRFANEVITKK